MPRIKLHKAFFAPNNDLLKPGEHEVPEEWTLPKGTEVLEGDDAPVVLKKAAGK